MAFRAERLAMARPAADGRPAYTKRTRYEQLRTAAQTERSSFDAHWKECADFVRPRRAKFQVTDKNRGDRRNQNIIDSTATYASRTLSSGLHAGMSSPARPWFKSTIADPDLARHKPVQVYLEEVTRRMQAFYSMANLYQALPIRLRRHGRLRHWRDGGPAGHEGPVPREVVPDRQLRDRPGQPGARDDVRPRLLAERPAARRGVRPHGRLRRYRLEPKFSATVKNLWDKGNYQDQVAVTWIVTPNIDYDPRSPRARFFKWSSCHFERAASGDTFLRESGYKTFPIIVPRWDVTDDDNYGTDWPCAIDPGRHQEPAG
jgi:hypothetical protein